MKIKFKMNKISFFATIVIFTFFMCFSSKSEELNEKLSDFKLKTLDGSEFSSESLKGKILIIDFWASWCSPCRKEIPFLIELKDKNKDKNVEILAINLDEKSEKAQKFIDNLKSKNNLLVLLDPKSTLPEIFKVEAMPTTLFVDKNGMIRFKHTDFTEENKSKYENELAKLLSE